METVKVTATVPRPPADRPSFCGSPIIREIVMEKRVRSLLFILCLAFALFLLASCGGGSESESVAAPTDASSTVASSADGASTDAASTNAATLPATEGKTVPAKTDDGVYTITFSIDGNETSYEVPRGETPVCPEDLLSWETAENYCKVTGWDKEIVPAECDATYTATVGRYGLTVYDVLFILQTGVVKAPTHEGEIPTPPKGYEIDDTQKYKIGSFKQWNRELTAPTAQNTENGKKKMSYTAIYTYEPRYVADVLPAKDGARGVLTMTYDFGVLGIANWVNARNKEYGTKGSFMMIPNWGGDKPDFDGNASKWAAIFADGTLEPESHSMTHSRVLPSERWSSYEESKLNNLRENYDVELVQSKAVIEAAFPGHAVLCFAPSNNTLSTYSFRSDGNGNPVYDESGVPIVVEDGGAFKVAKDTYFAIRQGSRGMQSLDPAAGDGAGGWYDLYMRSFKSIEDPDEKLTQSKSWLDEAARDGRWLIMLCRGVDGLTSGGDVSTDVLDGFLAHASGYVESGKLWAATFGEATRYIRERQNTTVSARFENGAVLVDMTINRTTKDDKYLTESVFNYPLTVDVRVPDEWKTVRYTVDGVESTAAVYQHDGASFAMVNLTPGADGVTVTTEISGIAAD